MTEYRSDENNFLGVDSGARVDGAHFTVEFVHTGKWGTDNLDRYKRNAGINEIYYVGRIHCGTDNLDRYKRNTGITETDINEFYCMYNFFLLQQL